jgi:hypothetical protein
MLLSRLWPANFSHRRNANLGPSLLKVLAAAFVETLVAALVEAFVAASVGLPIPPAF